MAKGMGGRANLNYYVADTHALFWYLTASQRLGWRAKDAFAEASRGQAIIYLPAIVLAELYFLNEKLGQPFKFAIEYQRIQQSSQFVFIPIQPDDILDFDKDTLVPEMHDRFIVGVARRLGAACLSRDGAIVSSQSVPVIWD